MESLAAPVMAVRDLAIAAGMDAADAVKRKLGAKERLAKTEKRRKYYATDAARRERQREQILEARPKITSKCPTPKEPHRDEAGLTYQDVSKNDNISS